MLIALLWGRGVAPCALVAIGAAHDRMLLAALPAASLLAVACGGAAIAMQAERKLGVVLVPLHGGPDAQVEIRPRPGTGVGLVIPFGRTLGHVAAFRTTTRSIPYLEAAAASSFGMVYFGVGAATLPGELVAWTKAVHDASRRRRSGLTLWLSAGDARMMGLDVTGLPASGIRCGGRVRGITSPQVRGPDAAAVAWVAAAIHATAAGSHR